MAALDFKQTRSWQDAVELGASLVSLAEALPAHEQSGLVIQLHQLMLDLPAQIAADLADSTRTRFVAIYRLATALELIEKIYPALDTAPVRNDFEKLVGLLDSEAFSEVALREAVTSEPGNGEVTIDHTSETAVSNDDESDVKPEPEIDSLSSFLPSATAPVSSPTISVSPSGVPIMGDAALQMAPVSPVTTPDISELPEGIAMSAPEASDESSTDTLPLAQVANVQPNSLQ